MLYEFYLHRSRTRTTEVSSIFSLTSLPKKKLSNHGFQIARQKAQLNPPKKSTAQLRHNFICKERVWEGTPFVRTKPIFHKLHIAFGSLFSLPFPRKSHANLSPHLLFSQSPPPRARTNKKKTLRAAGQGLLFSPELNCFSAETGTENRD